MNPGELAVRPVGTVLGGRDEWVEDGWGPVEAVIRLDAGWFEPSVLLGLDEFSHLQVVFQFDRVDPARINLAPRPPRGDARWSPVGVFAGRGPFRPNRLGVSTCRLLRVDGLDLHVAGLDALTGTPVLDVKPYLPGFAPRGPVAEPPWSTELMKNYY